MALIETKPLEDGYVRLGRAAQILARDHDGATTDDIMDAFKRAIFAGALSHDTGGLQMEIAVPRCTLPPVIAGMNVLPKAVYGVNRSTVASVLHCAEGLPGTQSDWYRLFDIGGPDHDPELPYFTLANIPFRDYPEIGRRELEALLISDALLRSWRESRGLPDAVSLPEPQHVPDAMGSLPPPLAKPKGQGRPQKRAWPRVVQLVRQLHREHPEWQKKKLAFEAWTLARQEFAKEDMPSVGSIQRDMVAILGGGSA
ncbi:MAG: hypothetical protein ABL901_18740 [Hyphomicrobiaceae bacterium]